VCGTTNQMFQIGPTANIARYRAREFPDGRTEATRRTLPPENEPSPVSALGHHASRRCGYDRYRRHGDLPVLQAAHSRWADNLIKPRDAEMHPGGLIRGLPYFGNSNAR
jgi:hypothetical protein